MKGVTRPKMRTMPEAAQIPQSNLRRPPATYTHRIAVAQSYFYEADALGEPAGHFAAGTRVRRLSADGALCRVVDRRGLSVYTDCAGLTPLRAPRKTTHTR